MYKILQVYIFTYFRGLFKMCIFKTGILFTVIFYIKKKSCIRIMKENKLELFTSEEIKFAESHLKVK